MKVTRYAPRPLDYDNMAGGLKFLIDALVSCGIIDDDNPSVVQSLTLAQEKVHKKDARMVIELTE